MQGYPLRYPQPRIWNTDWSTSILPHKPTLVSAAVCSGLDNDNHNTCQEEWDVVDFHEATMPTILSCCRTSIRCKKKHFAISCIMLPKGLDTIRLTINLNKNTTVLILNMFNLASSLAIQLKIKETLHILWDKPILNHQDKHVNLKLFL